MPNNKTDIHLNHYLWHVSVWNALGDLSEDVIVTSENIAPDYVTASKLLDLDYVPSEDHCEIALFDQISQLTFMDSKARSNTPSDIRPGLLTEHCQWVMHCPVISSSHITESDDRILGMIPDDFQTFPIITGALIIGHIIAVPDDHKQAVQAHHNELWQKVWEGLHIAEFSDAFIELYRQVISEGFNYFRIDRDGDTIPGLATFDW